MWLHQPNLSPDVHTKGLRKGIITTDPISLESGLLDPQPFLVYGSHWSLPEQEGKAENLPTWREMCSSSTIVSIIWSTITHQKYVSRSKQNKIIIRQPELMPEIRKKNTIENIKITLCKYRDLTRVRHLVYAWYMCAFRGGFSKKNRLTSKYEIILLMAEILYHLGCMNETL